MMREQDILYEIDGVYITLESNGKYLTERPFKGSYFCVWRPEGFVATLDSAYEDLSVAKARVQYIAQVQHSRR